MRAERSPKKRWSGPCLAELVKMMVRVVLLQVWGQSEPAHEIQETRPCCSGADSQLAAHAHSVRVARTLGCQPLLPRLGGCVQSLRIKVTAQASS